ncbi:MAG: glycosyltransferase family 9 protein [Elusimicrobia bacterium]|nr:glycosyltransferase family 9 protein [Elusimicrobiota bacterium]
MKILIIRLSSLGDIALLEPALKEIKRASPSSRVSLLVKPAYADLARTFFLDKVIEYEGFWATRRTLAGQRWDLVIDVHAVLRTRLLMPFIPAKRKITYAKKSLGRYFMLLKRNFSGHEEHVVERYSAALKSAGIGNERFVVLQTAFLGDAVLILPLMREIKRRLEPKELAIVTRPEHAAVFAREGFRVIEDDKHGRHRGLSGFWAMTRLLRQEHFDLAVVAHRSLRSALMAYLAGIPYRIGFSNSAGRFLLSKIVPFIWPEHDSERNLRLISALPQRALAPISADRSHFEIRFEAAHAREAMARWSEFGLDPEKDFIVGMAPGSKWATKRWFPERFIELAQMFQERKPQCRIVLIGGSEDQALCHGIAVQIGAGAVNLAGRFRLGELPALMRGLKLFVTNDSGPMHIANASGVPVVAVFGPTVRGFGFFPKGPRSRVVEIDDLSCRPCSLHGGRICPRGHFLCMELVTVPKVMAACEEVLALANQEAVH